MSALQVLLSTMNMENAVELCEKMNLNSDTLIINQCDHENYESFFIKNHEVKCYSFNERGLSISRNRALVRATGDIICLADDDVKYTETYAEDILAEYERHPEADGIVFNVDWVNGVRTSNIINSFGKVGKGESRKYSSVRITFKRDKVLKHNLSFDTMFGSGAYYKCGEDTIFLKHFLDCGLKLYKSPVKIGETDTSESTWFTGFNEKFFFDRGAIAGATYPKMSRILILAQAFRNSKRRLGSYKHFFKMYGWYKSGLKDFKERSK